jgi:hypothetical protein
LLYPRLKPVYSVFNFTVRELSPAAKLAIIEFEAIINVDFIAFGAVIATAFTVV